MRIARLPVCFAASMGLLSLLAPQVSSAAATKDQCIEANGDGQSLRREGKLSLAAERLRLCAKPECPAMVRDDCTKRLDDLLRAQPTLIFDVKDSAGGDLADVTVTMDGQPLVTQLAGTPIAVDLGKHEFTFLSVGFSPTTRTLVLAEGQGTRHIAVTLTPATTGLPITPPAAPPHEGPSGEASEPHGMSTKTVLGITFGAAGIVSLGVGGAAGLVAIADKNTANTDCPVSTCVNRTAAEQARSAAVSAATISTVTFIAGGALLVTGATLLLLKGPAESSKHPSALLVLPSVGPSSAGLFMRGEF